MASMDFCCFVRVCAQGRACGEPDCKTYSHARTNTHSKHTHTYSAACFRDSSQRGTELLFMQCLCVGRPGMTQSTHFFFFFFECGDSDGVCQTGLFKVSSFFCGAHFFKNLEVRGGKQIFQTE